MYETKVNPLNLCIEASSTESAEPLAKIIILNSFTKLTNPRLGNDVAVTRKYVNFDLKDSFLVSIS